MVKKNQPNIHIHLGVSSIYFDTVYYNSEHNQPQFFWI